MSLFGSFECDERPCEEVTIEILARLYFFFLLTCALENMEKVSIPSFFFVRLTINIAAVV